MKTNQGGIALIKKYEGFVDHVYKCPAGLRTIGYGHRVRLGERFPVVIRESDAQGILDKDLIFFEEKVKGLLIAPTTENQFSAMVSFAFNLGVGKLSTSTLLKFHNIGKYQKASGEFARWNKARVNGVLEPLEGLTVRRRSEKLLYLKA